MTAIHPSVKKLIDDLTEKHREAYPMLHYTSFKVEVTAVESALAGKQVVDAGAVVLDAGMVEKVVGHILFCEQLIPEGHVWQLAKERLHEALSLLPKPDGEAQ